MSQHSPVVEKVPITRVHPEPVDLPNRLQTEPERIWPELNKETAFHGLAGDIVKTIEPHTEADPAAILLQFLGFAGACIGRGPHYRVEGDRHSPNLFVVLVG